MHQIFCILSSENTFVHVCDAYSHRWVGACSNICHGWLKNSKEGCNLCIVANVSGQDKAKLYCLLEHSQCIWMLVRECGEQVNHLPSHSMLMTALMRCMLMLYESTDEVCAQAIWEHWWGVCSCYMRALMKGMLRLYESADEVCSCYMRALMRGMLRLWERWWGVCSCYMKALMRGMLRLYESADEVCAHVIWEHWWGACSGYMRALMRGVLMLYESTDEGCAQAIWEH